MAIGGAVIGAAAFATLKAIGATNPLQTVALSTLVATALLAGYKAGRR